MMSTRSRPARCRMRVWAVVNGMTTRSSSDPNAPPRKNNGITGDARKSTAALGKMAFDIKIDYAVKQIQGFLASQTKSTGQ